MASSGLEIPAIMYETATMEGMYLETKVREVPNTPFEV
jgi:hypothetical protein